MIQVRIILKKIWLMAAGVTEVTIRNRIRDLGRDVSIISANLLSRNSYPKNAPFGI